MLGLKLPTDPRWANIANENLHEILTDHAWCEQNATSNAISIIVSYPEHTEMVDVLLKIAQEELTHFEQVHQKIKERGYTLGRERKDSYVNELYKFMRKGYNRDIVLTDRLLFSAMIEARSCESFKLLAATSKDTDLAAFYADLMACEAQHYTTFITLAKKYADPNQVDKRWQEWLTYEAAIIQTYGKSETIHG